MYNAVRPRPKPPVSRSSNKSGLKNLAVKVFLGLLTFIVAIMLGINIGVTRSNPSTMVAELTSSLLTSSSDNTNPNDDSRITTPNTLDQFPDSLRNDLSKRIPNTLNSNNNRANSLTGDSSKLASHSIPRLSRRLGGFSEQDWSTMSEVIRLYAEWHTSVVTEDSKPKEGGGFIGRYLIIKPTAQMCNRLRAHLGAIFLGLVLKRAVFLDIATDNYAARLTGVFEDPGFTWELHRMPQGLRARLNSQASSRKLLIPYETAHGGRGSYESPVCDDLSKYSEILWNVQSHAAFLPLVARNKAMIEEALKKWESAGKPSNDFTGLLLSHFDTRVSHSTNEKEGGRIITQHNFEKMEVLLARILYRLSSSVQTRVDSLIEQAYAKARHFNGDGKSLLPPRVVGIHLRSEYIISMNQEKAGRGRGTQLKRLSDEFQWFSDCAKLTLSHHISTLDDNRHLSSLMDSDDFVIFVAADTRDAQLFAEELWGKDRVIYQPFEKTGKTLDGIIDAVVDLVTVASFDSFVSTPHSSYSEMASLLGQPRRRSNDKGKVSWLSDVRDPSKARKVEVNRPIHPMMTRKKWEIDKLNKYVNGRAVNYWIHDNPGKVWIQGQTGEKNPESGMLSLKVYSNAKVNFANQRICKQQVVAGMGWMGLFPMFRNLKCFDPEWHSPGFPFDR